MAGGDAVAGLEDEPGFERNVVDEGAVLAAQILHRPLVALDLEGEVQAGKAGVFRKAKVSGAGAAHGKPLAGERHGLHGAIGTLDQEFARHGDGSIVERSRGCLVQAGAAWWYYN